MTQADKILAELTAMRQRLDELHEHVVGKPGQQGLVTQQIVHEQRTTMLEQRLNRRVKLELGALSALIGLAIERAWTLLVRGH
jgi:hypothetical protein